MGVKAIAFWEMDGTHLHTVRSIDVSVEDPSADTVKTLSRNPWPLGHRRGMNEITYTLEAVLTDPPEFDWEAAQEDHTTHLAMYEEAIDRDTVGNRYLLMGLQIYSVGKTMNAEGDITVSVSGKALRHKAEPEAA